MAARKVIVVAIGVFGRLTDTESQVHGALLALFVFILTHTTMVPFPTADQAGKSVGNLETFALTCCFLTMYVCWEEAREWGGGGGGLVWWM